MLTAMLFLMLSAAQTAAPASDPYGVEDPFAIEAPAPAAPAVVAEAPASPSPERIICRSRPELGSRVRRLRVCMTAAQWAHHATNMEQQRRDINDMGAAGCDPNYPESC